MAVNSDVSAMSNDEHDPTEPRDTTTTNKSMTTRAVLVHPLPTTCSTEDSEDHDDDDDEQRQEPQDSDSVNGDDNDDDDARQAQGDDEEDEDGESSSIVDPTKGSPEDDDDEDEPETENRALLLLPKKVRKMVTWAKQERRISIISNVSSNVSTSSSTSPYPPTPSSALALRSSFSSDGTNEDGTSAMKHLEEAVTSAAEYMGLNKIGTMCGEASEYVQQNTPTFDSGTLDRAVAESQRMVDSFLSPSFNKLGPGEQEEGFSRRKGVLRLRNK